MACVGGDNTATVTPAKLPAVVKFAYADFKFIDTKKWRATCALMTKTGKQCTQIITETRGTTSAFVK